MIATSRRGRSGASLVEVLVATILVGVGVLIWWRAFDRSVLLLDEAHLGLHAAILLTEALGAGEPGGITRPVGPGRMEATADSGSVRVRYVPPGGTPDARPRAYWRVHEWTFVP